MYTCSCVAVRHPYMCGAQCLATCRRPTQGVCARGKQEDDVVGVGGRRRRRIGFRVHGRFSGAIGARKKSLTAMGATGDDASVVGRRLCRTAGHARHAMVRAGRRAGRHAGGTMHSERCVRRGFGAATVSQARGGVFGTRGRRMRRGVACGRRAWSALGGQRNCVGRERGSATVSAMCARVRGSERVWVRLCVWRGMGRVLWRSSVVRNDSGWSSPAVVGKVAATFGLRRGVRVASRRRVFDTTRRAPQEAGLGLALAREFGSRHGGTKI